MTSQLPPVRAAKRLGGMADILATASSLGLEPQVEGKEEGQPNECQFSQPFIRLLKEISDIQRTLVKLDVEVKTRQLEAETAHLTHLSELQMKADALKEATDALQSIIQNKDRLVAKLQQPYSVDSVPVETAFQADFQALLQQAASDCAALQSAAEDVRWMQAFNAEPDTWQEHLRSVPAALASCTRYSEALSSMREAINNVHQAHTRRAERRPG
ncbi:hypothetical protein KFL_000270470 [Klebsormidium nitens]|uniref:Uncharacterized protein n=1 Tax=Klebsormidium nitens TaxID=105231 RepID=A0A1Y1HRU1_KLENI|nr:hypothetical protein KFL_000270470 [Klebsormidium nitens]|eukprot:GAQ79287.1 hypothetical protein KFL_000270470 [Klebsormidium nitens]